MIHRLSLLAIILVASSTAGQELSIVDAARQKAGVKPVRVFTDDDLPRKVPEAPAPDGEDVTAPSAMGMDDDLMACSDLDLLQRDKERLRRKAERISGWLVEGVESEIKQRVYTTALQRIEEEMLLLDEEIVAIVTEAPQRCGAAAVPRESD